ncbi:MAG: type II secretion system protein N [Pseudomonadota bacterium]|jgi:general secretion pathway protein C|nr:PDZ domain-containing protein [Syntrophobacterales bacterium]MDI9556380.1 type II secretion system protein N [Pseudomonadota bacterium]NLX31732.1 PDZ domain-containing protein [Deltaproteobacteria bacterium]HNU85643.1 type II secretion system protein N [Syntrophales bacterium]HNZ34896.1 type II secretion system protein N [Syntrophales bacterium]
MLRFMKDRRNTVLILAGIAVVLYLAVDIAYRVLEITTSPPETSEQAAAGSQEADTTKDPFEAYAVIVERNLFRTTDRPIVVDQTDPGFLETANLPLDLYGTIAGQDGRGYAIIEERDKKKQRLYKVGDRVAGATILKIFRNAVVLRVGDRDQVLKKKEMAARGAGRMPPAGIPGPAPGPAPEAAPRAQGRLPQPPPGTPSDLASLLTQARVTPHVTAGSSGKPDGVVINEIQPGSIFENAGLINGDVIHEVNGRPVAGVADLVSMYRDLRPGLTLSVKVTRAGRQVVLNHTVQ